MNHLNEQINSEIIERAYEIKSEVPYWMQERAVQAVKRVLKKCYKLKESGNITQTLNINIELLKECLVVLGD